MDDSAHHFRFLVSSNGSSQLLSYDACAPLMIRLEESPHPLSFFLEQTFCPFCANVLLVEMISIDIKNNAS